MKTKHSTLDNYILGKTLGAGYHAKVINCGSFLGWLIALCHSLLGMSGSIAAH